MSPRSAYPPPGHHRPDLRIGDAERERAASQLAEHYAVGRLTREEHSERLDRIWAARTQAELDPAFVDLPSVDPPGQATRFSRPVAPRPRGRGRPRLPLPLLALLVVLAVVAVATNLPLILVGLGVWFFFVRGGCGSRSSWGHSRRW